MSSNNTAEFAHLRPLSVYSQSIIFNTTVAQADDVFWCPTSPFCNIKVERVNSSASVGHKRQLDDSCLDETYETPLKKLCLAKCHSPDLSCVLDSSDALPDAKPVTPKSSSVVAHKIGCSSTRTNAPDERLPSLQGCAHLVWSLGYHSGQQGTVTMAMASQVMEDGDVSVTEQKEMSRFQVAFSESSSADSFESTLPLQVQVGHKKASVHFFMAHLFATSCTMDICVFGSGCLPFFTGVVTELLHLMSTVANQETGRDGSQWQHPSDLTRRNYQQRNSGRLLSLNQWQNLNHRGRHRRFAKVPAVFQRSPVL
uniref:S100P-binding protein n=1 Tax=Electrophorus electricus TaxID=8005 RepID=A0A4W4H7F7_ELEEL